jgi:zinc protease
MRKLILAGLLIALAAGTVTAEITLPEPDVIQLENGLTVQVIERSNLPLFSFQLTFRAGSTHDPVGKEGLASLASDMLMRGTETRTAKGIADEVAFGGGTLSNFCAKVSAGFQGEFLAEQGENAFEILADLVYHSSVTDEELNKTKERTLGGLASRKENPATVAGEAIFNAILGDSRYAHFSGGTPETVAPLTRDDVVEYIADHYTPDNCILVVAGDVDTETVKEWVSKYFVGWTGTTRAVPPDAPFPTVTGTEVIIYDKLDATQTQIRIGGNGMPMNHEDYHALEVARTVYGGSFTSRLMQEIRVNRGLTYGVRFRSQRYQPGGLAYVGTSTGNANVGEVIDLILAEAKAMQSEIVPPDEFEGAINYQNGTYPLDFETNDDLAGVFSNLWLNNLDESYYEKYQEALKEISPEEALAVSQKYFPQDNYKLVLVGKADEIKSQVEKYGPVTVIPLADE